VSVGLGLSGWVWLAGMVDRLLGRVEAGFR